MLKASDSNDTPPPAAPQGRVNKANRKTFAARWNNKQFDGLRKLLKRDPEADLTSAPGPKYSATLYKHKDIPPLLNRTAPAEPPDADVRATLRPTAPCRIVFGLSSSVTSLLSDPDNVAQSIIHLLSNSGEAIYKSPCVFRVNDTIVLKVTSDDNTTVEMGSLLYLQQHLPSFPAPRLHGLVHLGPYGLLFISYIPGMDLERAWPQLQAADKQEISAQIDALLQTLRQQLPFPPPTAPWEVCKGKGVAMLVVVYARILNQFLLSPSFKNSYLRGAEFTLPLYMNLLRELRPAAAESKCVFTHGDVRPANIIVKKRGRQGEDGSSGGGAGGGWAVVAIIDWEMSGFYPDYWEAIKMTNNLTPSEEHDWYEYLPASVSPQAFPQHWLLDKLLDRSMVNS